MGKKSKNPKSKIAQSKIMQCCYCGVQSAFLPDRTIHSLVCETCAAPLSVQKRRPTAAHKGALLPESEHHSLSGRAPGYMKKVKKVGKRGKPLKKKKTILARVFDLAEDLLDDIFD